MFLGVADQNRFSEGRFYTSVNDIVSFRDKDLAVMRKESMHLKHKREIPSKQAATKHRKKHSAFQEVVVQ